MNSRERVKRAIEFRGPDRVPTCLYDPLKGDVLPIIPVPARTWQPPEPYFPYDVHPAIMQMGLWKPGRKLPKGWKNTLYTAMDEWECLWDVKGGVTSKGQIKKGALQDGWDLLDSYTPPDPYREERYAFHGIYRKLLGINRYRCAIGDDFLFSRFHFIRGFEQAMTDLIMFPDEVSSLLDKMTDFFLGYVEMVGERGTDGVMLADDLGTQQDLIISPGLFREFFKPRYRRVVEKAHEKGMHFILHSCGNIRRVIPDLIEIGVDALQLDAPNQTGLDYLSENFEGSIAFFNVVDIQEVFPKGDPDELEQYVVDMIRKLGSCNGGLVATTYPTLYAIGATREREKHIFRCYRKHGTYPLKNRGG